MYTTRRSFLKRSGMALAGAAVLPHELLAAERRKKHLLGIQLYSVRDDMKKDPAGTLKQLSVMGYKHVEHANYIDRKFYGYAAADFKKLLDDTGLTMRSGHTRMNSEHWDAVKNDFTDAWKQTVANAAVVGQQYVISPWLEDGWRKTMDDLKQAMAVFNKCGELCQKQGLKFG